MIYWSVAGLLSRLFRMLRGTRSFHVVGL